MTYILPTCKQPSSISEKHGSIHATLDVAYHFVHLRARTTYHYLHWMISVSVAEGREGGRKEGEREGGRYNWHLCIIIHSYVCPGVCSTVTEFRCIGMYWLQISDSAVSYIHPLLPLTCLPHLQSPVVHAAPPPTSVPCSLTSPQLCETPHIPPTCMNMHGYMHT